MKRVLIGLAALTLSGGIASLQAAPAPQAAAASMPAPMPTEVIRYGEAPSQFVEVFIPSEGTGPWPVVVFIHGGCYVSTDADVVGMRRTYADLAGRGVAVWGIEYSRVDEPTGAFPGLYRDVAAATDLVRDHAARLNLDLDRVVLAGHSAGGHLALWEAARDRLPETSPLRFGTPLSARAVVAVAGPGDLEPLKPLFPEVCGAGVFEQVTGEGLPGRDDPYADTSPSRQLPLGLPIRLFVGATDTVVTPGFVNAYAEQARAAGDDVTEQVLPDADHIDVIRPRHPAWTAIADAIAAEAKGRE